MTLTQILADLYSRLRYQTVPAAAVTTRLTAFVNETYRELIALPGIDRLRDDVIPITAKANQARVGLPPQVGRIHAIVDRANQRQLEEVPLLALRRQDPGQVATGGPPIRFAVLGYRQVQIQPATTGLWAVSSSASDTTQKVFCETLTTGGYRHVTASAGTTLTGLTRVALGARTDHIEVDAFHLDLTTTVGYISLYDAATNGTELARIAPGELSAKYLTVEWYPIPTADTTEYLDYSRNIFDLTVGSDEPLIPADFHYVLSLGARMKEYETIDDNRIVTARADYERGKGALRAWLLDDGTRIASLRPTPIRWSRLGANFPPNG